MNQNDLKEKTILELPCVCTIATIQVSILELNKENKESFQQYSNSSRRICKDMNSRKNSQQYCGQLWNIHQ